MDSMKELKFEHIESKIIRGISTRTTNLKETNPDEGRIPGLWQRFDANVQVNYKGGARVYGVYFDYESDATGEFTVLTGTDQENCTSSVSLEEVKIEKGKYLVFHGAGSMPEIVIQTWGAIWNYFARDNCEYKRKYTTDFEKYLSESEIEIYIAIE